MLKRESGENPEQSRCCKLSSSKRVFSKQVNENETKQTLLPLKKRNS